MIRFGDLGNWLKDTRGWLFLSSVRWLERRLSVRNLYRFLWPHACLRAALRGIPVALPLAGRDVEKPARATREERIKGYLNEILEYLPDRLAEPKWLSGCRFAGLDRLRRARQNGRPVVLVFRHTGPYALLRPWLRAAGYPVSILVGGKAEGRSRMRRWKDRLFLFPEVPGIFNLDQLRAADEFLAAGNSLLVAIDPAAGKQMDVPAGDGRTIRMATGAVRLAIRHGAELIPCSIIDEGRWRFRIELGRPVPAECLAAETDMVSAGKHLVNELFPHWGNHAGPGQ